MNEPDRCARCGAAVAPGDGFRAYEPARSQRAAFCRLEHVIPWIIRGPRWEAGEAPDPAVEDRPAACAHCGARLGEGHVLLVRHRGEHRIPDAFCDVGHLAEWAKAGGRWR